ncbi:MAG TPA: hypothetical protein VJ991_05145 [Balneolales bacterium]|nr:hypothetical protein [Balneolales bacterium]
MDIHILELNVVMQMGPIVVLVFHIVVVVPMVHHLVGIRRVSM